MMQKILALAIREYLAAVKTKGFIIGLILAPILMCGGFIGIALFKNNVDTVDKKVAVLDHSGKLAHVLTNAAKARNDREVIDTKTGKKVQPAYLFEIITPETNNIDAQKLMLSDRIRNNKLHAFIEINTNVLHPPPGSPPPMQYYAKNAAIDDIRRWAANPLNDELRRLRLAEAGIEPGKIKNLFDWSSLESMGLLSRDKDTGKVKKAERRSEAEAFLVPMASVFFIYMLCLMGAAPLLHTVMEEKNQRIAEVLLGSMTPFQFMMGKIIGALAVSLTGSVVYVSAIAATLYKMDLHTLIPYTVIPWLLAYLFLAVIMYGSIFAALGSACNDAKDAQSMQLPAMLPLIIPMFLLVPLIQQPQSGFAIGMSLIPPFTPMVMMLRLSTPGGIPSWQPWIGLAGVMLFTLLCVWAGGRIFRVAILLQGKPPKVADLMRWIIKG